MAVAFNREHARFKTVHIPVGTKIKREDGSVEKKNEEFETEVPASLKDAIAAEGEKKVFRRYLQSLAIELQGERRKDLQEKKPGERRRASYLEEVDAY